MYILVVGGMLVLVIPKRQPALLSYVVFKYNSTLTILVQRTNVEPPRKQSRHNCIHPFSNGPLIIGIGDRTNRSRKNGHMDHFGLGQIGDRNLLEWGGPESELQSDSLLREDGLVDDFAALQVNTGTGSVGDSIYTSSTSSNTRSGRNDEDPPHTHTHMATSSATAVHDPLSNTFVPFPNASEALIASLRLEHRLSVPVVNLFLGVLRDERFRVQEVRFGDAGDVDLGVARWRGDVGDARGGRVQKGGESSSLGLRMGRTLPYPILLGILEALATDQTLEGDEQTTIHNTHINSMPNRLFKRETVFRAMSLVHRSWTTPAQLYLTQRVVIRSVVELLRLLRNPIIVRGATEELVISLGALWNRGFYFFDSETVGSWDVGVCGDVEFDIIHLMKRMPRLRKLHLLESGLHEGIVLSQVSQMRSLTKFTWIRAYGYPNCDFSILCVVLDCLPNLKELEISGWTFRVPLEERFKTDKPMFELDSLCLTVSPAERFVGQVGWLIQALQTNGNAQLKMDVTMLGRFSLREILKEFPRCEGVLEKLGNLHVINKGGFEDSTLEEMRSFVKCCKNVKKLHIQSKHVPVARFVDIVPPSVEELSYSWFDMWALPWDIVETHMPRLIRSEQLPRLKKVVLNNYEVPFYHLPPRSDEIVGHPAPNTQIACNERGVVLELSNVLDSREE